MREIKERHEAGQPILIGTISVEVSEMLGAEFTRNGIDHVVLNAKPEHAQREGETIAQAGRIGAVTIATNMAGRGVDIKLGGDPEAMARAELAKKGVKPGDEGFDAALAEVLPVLEEQCAAEGEKVIEAGGLFICGTERHESRRIDNQLRGRSGRQGDPGESRFFLSAEDDLVRLFAGDRIYKILDRLGPVDEEGEEYPLEAKMLSKQIENAQKKVEQQNFLIRKRVLEYDDVMNEQRRVIYKYRREILEGRDMSEVAYEEVGQVAVRLTEEFTPGDIFEDWDLAGLASQAESIWGGGGELQGLDPNTSSREDIGEMLREEALKAYEAREEELGEELTRWLERQILLQIIDNRWREHLYEMDYLREGIHLRGFAQIDPLVAYKNEGFIMFEELMASIWQEFARVIFHVEVNVEPQQQQQPAARAPQEVNYSGGTADGQPSALRDAAAAAATGAAPAAAATAEPPPEQPARPRGAHRHRRQVRAREARPQRPLLVRLRQEVQELPRRLTRRAVTALAEGPDGRPRCWWGVSAPDYVAYHDEEWGRPVTDDRGIYEKLTLEAFQSGLSWLTILRKRENFRAAFDGFDFERRRRLRRRATFERLMADAGIVRNRAKIEAAIANARATRELVAGGESLPRSPGRHRPEAERGPARDRATSPRSPPSRRPSRRSSSAAASGSSARPRRTR